MARVFHDGFETGTPVSQAASGEWCNSLWQLTVASYSAAVRYGRAEASPLGEGDYSFSIFQNSAVNSAIFLERDLGADYTEHYGRAAIQINELSGTVRLLFFRDSSDVDIAQIGFAPGAPGLVDIILYRGTTEIARLGDAFSTGTTIRLEWRLVVDNVSGVFEIRRNGDSVLSFNGDTRGTANANGMHKVGLGKNYSDSTNLTIFYDHFAINDTTGTINNSWVGPGSILLLKPKGAGNYTQFTPDSGNNFARVNEIPHTSDTAYVESDTADQIDTYEMQTLADLSVDTSDPAFNIKAAQHVMAGRWDEAETKLSRVLRSGTTDNTGTAVTLTNTYNRYWDEMFNVNPFDSLEWELADLNSLEAGVKHIAST